jgi:hypothetical protein
VPLLANILSEESWQLYPRLWADCLENVGCSTSHNRMGLHGLLQGQLDFTIFLNLCDEAVEKSHMFSTELFFLLLLFYTYINIHWRIFSHPSSRDVKDRLNCKLHLIRSHDWNVTGLCSLLYPRNERGRRETSFRCDNFPRKPGLRPDNCFNVYQSEEVFFAMFVVTSSFTHRVVVHFTVLASILNLTIISKGNIGPKLWHKMLFFFLLPYKSSRNVSCLDLAGVVMQELSLVCSRKNNSTESGTIHTLCYSRQRYSYWQKYFTGSPIPSVHIFVTINVSSVSWK